MPRMRSPQELLRDSRRELLSRSPRSSSPLERSEPIALMERGRTCGLFFPPLRNRPRRNSHSLRQPPSPRAVTRTLPSPQQPPLPAAIIPYCNRLPPQRPPYLSQRRVADEPWRRMFAARTARHRAHAALRRAVTRTLPSPQHPPRRPMKLASIPHAAAALRHRLARIAPYAFSFRRMHAIRPLPGNVCPKCMLFEIGMARSSPYASISRCNQVVLDTWRKDLAGKVPFSRRETRNHA